MSNRRQLLPAVIAIATALLWVAAAVMICVLCFGCSASAGEVWHWSPPAAHHQAVCLVDALNTRGEMSSGSGCYVQVGNVLGVLTARHCVDGQVSIRWADGTQSSGEPTTDKSGADLAFVMAKHPSLRPLELAVVAPQPGEWLEFCGFGGPKDQLRHWYGRLSSAGRDEFGNPFSDYTSAVMQGDSGGPVLNRAAQVVGVITVGGGQPIASLGSAKTFPTTGGPAYSVVADFGSRVGQRYGGLFIGGVRGSCGPSGCGPSPDGGSDRWAYPPQSPPPCPPQPPRIEPAPVPLVPLPPIAPYAGDSPSPPPACVPIDLQALADLLANDPRFRGPAGAVSPTPTIPTAAEIAAALPPVRVQIVDGTGKVLQDQAKPLGQPIRFQFLPKP